jgi:hypothetical protein
MKRLTLLKLNGKKESEGILKIRKKKCKNKKNGLSEE